MGWTPIDASDNTGPGWDAVPAVAAAAAAYDPDSTPWDYTHVDFTAESVVDIKSGGDTTYTLDAGFDITTVGTASPSEIDLGASGMVVETASTGTFQWYAPVTDIASTYDPDSTDLRIIARIDADAFDTVNNRIAVAVRTTDSAYYLQHQCATASPISRIQAFTNQVDSGAVTQFNLIGLHLKGATIVEARRGTGSAGVRPTWSDLTLDSAAHQSITPNPYGVGTANPYRGSPAVLQILFNGGGSSKTMTMTDLWAGVSNIG